MSLKKSFALLLILTLLGVYIYKVELPREEQKLKSQNLLPGVSKEELASIEITNSKGSFTLINSGAGNSATGQDKSTTITEQLEASALSSWQFADLKDADIDRGALNSLLSLLLELKLDKSIPADQLDELSVYGLDKTEVTIKTSNAGKYFELKIGKKNEYVGKRYLQVTGNPAVYLVPDSLYLAANKPRTDFRSRTPLDFTDADLVSFAIHSSTQKLKVDSLSAAKWQIVEPLRAQASSTEISNLTMAIRNLSAQEFIEGATERLGDFNLAEPQLRLSLVFKEHTKKKPLEVRIGSVSGKEGDKEVSQTYLFIEGKSTVFKLTADPFPGLTKPVNALREKKLFGFPDAAERSSDRGTALRPQKNT